MRGLRTAFEVGRSARVAVPVSERVEVFELVVEADDTDKDSGLRSLVIGSRLSHPDRGLWPGCMSPSCR